MKLKTLLELGSALTVTTMPQLAGAITAVNALLPKDKQLPPEATGAEIENAMGQLPDEVQFALMEKEIELEVIESNNWTDIQKTHSETDSKGASTRPFIALLFAWAVVFVVVPMAWILLYAIVKNMTDMIDSIGGSWPWLLSAIAPLLMVIRAYFGLRTSEKKSRYAASVGQDVPTNPLAMVVSGLINKGK